MAKRSDKCRYLSPSSPGEYVTAAQYIGELICHHRATSLKTNLPIKFWRLPDWKQYFLYQVRLAYPLIKTHGEKAVIRAIEDNRSSKTYSLRNPRLLRIIKEKAKEVAKEKIQPTTIPKVYAKDTTLSKPRKRQRGNTLLGKLMEIDDGEEKDKGGTQNKSSD